MGIFDDIESGRLSSIQTIDPDTGLTKSEAAIDKVRETEETGVNDISTGRALSRDLTGRKSTDFVDGKLWGDAVKGGKKVWGSGTGVGQGSGVYIGDDYTDYAAAGQSTGDKWGNGLLKLGGKSVVNTVGGLGMIGTAIAALVPNKEEDGWGWNFRNVYENEFHNSLDDINEWMDYKLPNYVSKEESDNNFFQSMGTANFWAGDLFGNAVPFVLGAVLTEVALSFATAASGFGAAPAQGAATVGIVAKGASLLSKFARAGRGASKLQKGFKLSRQILTGAGYESGVEARNHINVLEAEFTADFFKENGRAPNDQERADIRDRATQSGNWVFAGNLALVGGGNILQFPKIFGPGARSLAKKPLGKIARDAVTDPYKAAYKSWSKSRNIIDAGYHALRNPIWEGIIEEGGQGWIDNAAHHNAAKYWARKHNASGIEYGLGMIGALGDTFAESYGSKEAWKEIGMGMLIGGIGLPTYTRSGKKTEAGKDARKFEMQGGMFEPLRERAEKRARTDMLVEAINKNPSAVNSLRHKFENYSRAVDLQMEKDGSLAENDMFTYKNAENDEFFSFMSSRLEAGLYNDVIADITRIEDMSNDQFVEEFGYTDIATKENWSDEQISTRKNKVVESALAQAQKVKESTDLIDNKFEGIEGWSQEEINKAYTQFAHHLPAGHQTVENLNKVIREQLIHSASTIESVDRRHDEVSARLDEITGGVLREEGATDLATQMRKSSMVTFGARARAISNALSKNETLEDTDPNKMDEATIAQLNQELGYLQAAIAAGMQDNAIDDSVVMEAFEKNNPKEFAKEDVQKEVLGLLRDLRKLNARRQEFIGYYNGLFTKKGQQEALTQVEFFMDEEAAKAKEEQKKEAEDALRERRLKDFRMFTADSEFRVNKDLHGDIGYYKWVPESESVLFNVKDPNDQLNINDILQEGPNGSLGFKPGRSLLSSIEMEQRRIVEAIENIRTTQPQKIIDTQKKIAETMQKVEDIQAQMEIWAQTLAAKKDKSGNIRVPEGSVYQTGENKGKVIPRKAVKREDVKDLYTALGEQLETVEQQKIALEEDVATLIANREVFDKLLLEIESPGFSQAMPLNERAEYEASLGRDALHELGVESVIEDMAGNTRFKSPGEIMADAADSVLTTEKLLNEVGDMISILSTDIENLTEVNRVIRDMILDDDLAHLVQEFEKLYPGVAPTYPAVTKFLNENFRGKDDLAHLVDTFSEEMFKQMTIVNKSKAEHKLMLDEFYANTERIEELKQTLAETKEKEAALVDLWDTKLKGVEKVQRAITFSQAYQILQDQLGAIYLAEHSALDSPIVIQPAVLESSLTEEGEAERTTDNTPPPNPPAAPSGPKGGKASNKHSISLVGWWHSTGLDKSDKNKEGYGVVDGVVQEEYMTSSQRRWFKTISTLPESKLKELRLTAVTKKTNVSPELVDEFIPGDGIDEHIFLVLSNEDGTPYRVDGNLVYSTMPVTDPKGEKIYFPKTFTNEAQRVSFLNSRHNDFVKYRQSIIDGPVGGISLLIDGVSRGSAVEQLDSNGKPVFESVVGRITEGGIESIKDIELFVAVPQASKKLTENQGYTERQGKKLVYLKSGSVYAKYKGRSIYMKRRNVTETEADIALKLLKSLSRGEAVAEGTDVDGLDYLKDLLGYRYNTTQSKIYIDTNLDGVDYLIFGPNSIQLKELDLEAETVTTTVDPNTGEKVISRVPIGNQASIDKVKMWIMSKWHNVNKTKFNKPYVALELSETDEFTTKEYDSYEEYLMFPRENILDTPLGASIVPQSDDISNTQFRGQNLLFPISSSATKSAEQVRKESNAEKMQPQEFAGPGTSLGDLKLSADDVSNPTASGVTTNYKVINKDGMVVGEEYTLNITEGNSPTKSTAITIDSEGVLKISPIGIKPEDGEGLIAHQILEDLNANLTPTDKFSTIFDKLTLGDNSLMSKAEIVSVAGTPVISGEVKDRGETLAQSLTGGFQIIDSKDEQAFLAGLTPAKPKSTSEVKATAKPVNRLNRLDLAGQTVKVTVKIKSKTDIEAGPGFSVEEATKRQLGKKSMDRASKNWGTSQDVTFDIKFGEENTPKGKLAGPSNLNATQQVKVEALLENMNGFSNPQLPLSNFLGISGNITTLQRPGVDMQGLELTIVDPRPAEQSLQGTSLADLNKSLTVITDSEAVESFIAGLKPAVPPSNMSSLGKLEGDLMASEQGEIGVNKQQLLMLLGPTMYNKPLGQVAVKELLQNSFDAIKARMNLTGNTTTGNIEISVNYDNRTISMTDDGIGMTPDIVKNAFLSIGGTNKEGLDVSERSGGFGLAKVQFLLGSEYVKVVTVRDGVKTSISASSIELYNDDFSIETENTNEPNGSFVEVKIPKSYTTPEGTTREIDFPGTYAANPFNSFNILQKPLLGDVNINFNWVRKGEKDSRVLPIGVNTTEETLPPLFSKIEFSWGTADLYMSTEKKERGTHKILSSGIYQFDHRFRHRGYETIPYDIVVNIKPSVASISEQYPFNNQREGFKNTVSKDISALNKYLMKYASGEAEKDAKAAFSSITSLPKADPNKVLTAEEREKIYADVNQRIADNKQRRIDEGLETAEEAVRRIRSILINAKGVQDKETGAIEVGTEKDYDTSFQSDREIKNVDAIETLNFNPALPQYHNNTSFDYLSVPGAAEFFSEFGSVVLELVRFAGNELGYDYKKLKSSDEKFFAGVSIDKQYGGVHVRKIIDAIFVNPLAFNAESLEEAVGIALHVAIHEINHTTVSGEGADFTSALGVLYGKIYGTGKYGLYEGLFRSVYKKHFETFKKLKYEYDKSNTRNLSESFDGNNLKGSPTRALQGNADELSTRQSAEEGYFGDQEGDTSDKTGDVILSKVQKGRQERFTDTVQDLVASNDVSMAPATTAQRAKEVAWHKNKFLGLPIILRRGLIDGTSHGRTINAAKVILSDLSTKGTVYHESVHVVLGRFTTPEARQKLYDAYSRLTGVKVDIEEGMSEEFRNWMIAGPGYVIGKGTRADQTFIQKFFQALKDFLNLLTGHGPAKDRQQLIDFFQEIQATTYSKIEASAYPFKLSQDLKIKIAGTNENLSTEQSRDIVDTIIGNMFKVLEAKNSLSVSEFLELSSSAHSEALNFKFGVAIADAWNIHKRDFGEMFKPGGYFSASDISEQREAVSDFTKIWENQANINRAIMQWFSQFNVGLEEEAVEESKEFSRQYNIKEVNEIDIKESAPQVVKLLMATLPAPKSDVVNTAFGHNLVDGRSFPNLIQRKLSGLADFNDQIAVLEELVVTHSKYGGVGGPIQVLIERLKPTKGDALTPGEFRMQRLFRQQFHKFITSDVIALRSKDENGKSSIRLIPAAGERQATQVIARFSANLMTLTREKKSMFTVNEEGIAILDSSKQMKIMGIDFTLQDFLDNAETLGVDTIVAGLPYFGIDITSPETLTADEKEILSEEFLHIVGQLLKRKNVPMIDFFSKESGAFSRLQRIATVEADRSSETLDFSFQSPTGKSMYGVINNTYATNIIGRLNNGKIPNHMLKNGEVKEVLQGSIFIDGATKGYKVGLGSLQGVSEESSRRGKDLQDVSPNTLFQTEFIAVLSGKIPMLASADSKTEFVLDLTTRSSKVKGADKSLFSKIPTTEKAFIKQSKLYLRQELVQMKLSAGKGNNSLNSSSLYATYNEASKSLIFYEYMLEGNNPLPLGDLAKMTVDEFLATYDAEITAKLQEQEDVRRDELLQAAINAGVFTVHIAEDNSYVTMLSDEVLENLGVAPGKSVLTKAQVNKILNAFNRIHTVIGIEQSLIIFGSPGFYRTGEFFKRTKGANGPKKFADVGPEIDSWLKVNRPRRDNKVPDGKIRIVIREDVHVSVYQEQFEESSRALGMSSVEITKKLADPNARISAKGELIWIAQKGWLDFEEGDGSGRASMDEYNEFMERVGDITDPQRAAYAKYVKGIRLTPSEIAIFPVIKPQFFGPSFNSDISAMMMLKLSVVPMIPNSMRTVASDSVLALEADDMEKNKVGLTVFASGTKLGRIVDAFGKSNAFYNEDGTYAPIQEGFIQEIPYEYFGIQVDMEDKIHTLTVEGAQQRVIRGANIFENGVVVEGKEDLAIMDQLVNELSDETVRSQFDILADGLGLIVDDGKYKLGEGGAQRFAEIIIAEAKRRKMGDAYIEGLERFVDSPSRVLDLIGNKQRVESLLHSLVANSVVRHKTFGGSKVLIASSGFEANGSRKMSDIKATYQDRHLFGANYETLQFYREGKNGASTTAMEVYLPHYFKELIGENVEIIDGNIYSDGELIGGPELLEVYGFRIPTTALNSMEGIIIKGFLPQSAGDAIMVPSEHMVKAGSDFDIDKLTIYLQNYLWDKGAKKLSKVKYLTAENSTTLERVVQLRKLDPKKYRLLHKSHGDIKNLDKHFIRLEKDLRKYKKDLYKINNTIEARNLQGLIDDVYSQIKGTPTRAGRDMLYMEIGLLQSQLINLSLHKKAGINSLGVYEGNAYQLHDSLPVKITETLNKLEKIGNELDRVLTMGIEKANSPAALLASPAQSISIPMQNAQKAIANETLDLSRAMVLHSANFDQLIRPVGTARLKTYAEVIRKLKGKGAENKKRYSMLDFEKMLGVRKEFWTGKAGLEIAAVETLHQIKAQRVGLAVSVGPKFKMPFESVSIVEKIDPETQEVSTYIPVGSIKDVRGENYISEIIGEFTNAFVDVANDPFVPVMNINPVTAGVAFAMLRSQIHLSDVVLFTSALALEDYVAAKMEGTSQALYSIEEKYKALSELVIEELPKSHVPTELAELWTQRHMSEMLSLEPVFIKFREAINNKVTIKKALAQANKATGSAVTFAMLEHYIHQQQAVIGMYGLIEDNLARPITAVSQAVVGDRSSGSPRSRAHARLLVKRRNNLNAGSYLNLDAYMSEGVQGGFEGALTKTSTLFNDLFMTEKVELGAEIIDELIEEASGFFMSFADKIKYADLVEHNFTSYVLASVATENSDAMYKEASRLFQGNELQDSLPRRLQHLKNSTTGSRYLILQELFPILTTKERTHEGYGIENIKRFNKKLTQYESNMLSEDFESLMDSDPALGRDLIKFILLQSGTMTSPITWIHLLPALHYAAVVEPIIEQYIKHGEQLSLGAFRPQFMKNNVSNPIVVPQRTGRHWQRDAGPTGNKLGPSSVRFDPISRTGRSTVSKTMSERGRPKEIAVWIDTPISKNEIAEISRRYGEKLNESGARLKLKDEGKKVGSFKLFIKSKASIESEAQFMKFAETHNKDTHGELFAAYKKKLGHPIPVITWEQHPTLGNGIYFKEYGPPGHMSIIRENNTMRSGVDMTGMSFSEVDSQANLSQIIQGNPALMFGVVVNSDTTLAGARLPIFALKDTVISPGSNEWVLSMVMLRDLADKYPTNRFLIPPLGLGFAEGGTDAMIQSKVIDLSELIKSRPNITIVFPEKSGVEALDSHFENVMKNLTCK